MAGPPIDRHKGRSDWRPCEERPECERRPGHVLGEAGPRFGIPNLFTSSRHGHMSRSSQVSLVNVATHLLRHEEDSEGTPATREPVARANPRPLALYEGLETRSCLSMPGRRRRARRPATRRRQPDGCGIARGAGERCVTPPRRPSVQGALRRSLPSSGRCGRRNCPCSGETRRTPGTGGRACRSVQLELQQPIAGCSPRRRPELQHASKEGP